MKEEQRHINPWAEKLSHLQLPDENNSWREMELVLDKELPVARDNRRWLLLLAFLLLLIGVCTCPGIWNSNAPLVEHKQPADSSNRNGDDNSSITRKAVQPRKKVTNRHGQPHPTDSVDLLPSPVPINKENVAPPTEQSTAIEKDRNPAADVETQLPTRQQSFHRNRPLPKTSVALTTVPSKKEGRGSEKEKYTSENRVSKKPVRDNERTYVTTDKPQQKTKNERRDTPIVSSPGRPDEIIPHADTVSVTELQKDSIRLLTDSSIRKSLDSTAIKGDSLKQQKRAQIRRRDRGFAAAVGFNHSFTLGKQERSSFNSSGESGTWADYLPVAQLRYHFNSRLYLSGEVQLQAPQFTPQVLLAQVITDSNSSGQRRQHSVYVKKLFYFNLPVSVHITPVKNLQLGAGIQYSRLKNAVGLFEEKQLTPNRPDSFKISTVKSIKADSSYDLLKTNEFRLLADVSYKYKRFAFGARYNQALSSFISLPVAGTDLKQARNNSLQIYVRYTFWDQRKSRYILNVER